MLYEPYLRISTAKIQIIFEICKYFYHFCYLIFLFFCIFLKYLHFSIFFVPSARPYIYVVASLTAATSFQSQKSTGFSTHRSYSAAIPGCACGKAVATDAAWRIKRDACLRFSPPKHCMCKFCRGPHSTEKYRCRDYFLAP